MPTEILESDTQQEEEPVGSSGGVVRPSSGKKAYVCTKCGQIKKGHTCSKPEGGAPKVKAKESNPNRKEAYLVC